MTKSMFVAVVILVILPIFFASGDIVTDWNQTALTLSMNYGLMGGRTLAMVHTAMYDATVAFGGGYKPYHVKSSPQAGASMEAAATSAAYKVLYTIFTEDAQRQIIQNRYDSHLAVIPDGFGKDAGIAFGTSVGQSILMLRSTDGVMAAMMTPYPDGTEPGEWRRTASGEPMAPGWGNVTPWTMTVATQFNQSGPPPLNSHEYSIYYEETRVIGGADSVVRTEEQSEIALFWNEPVPGKWHGLAREISQRENLSLKENARLFALLSVAMADANISAWKMKYSYGFWRPETAINLGDDDTNNMTSGYPSWQPFLISPAHPEYLSAHSITSAAGAKILELYFGKSNYTFELMSMEYPGLGTREFNNFWEAVEECGISRIYGGIHFQFSNLQGQTAGRNLAYYVFANFMTEVSGSSNVVGLIRMDLGVGRNLVSTPYLPFSTSLDDFIGNQLTGSPLKFFSDIIESWNPALMNYDRAWFDSSENKWKDWETDGDPVFLWEPDKSYWIVIQQFNTPKTIRFTGNVSEINRIISIDTGRNLAGVTFPVEVSLPDSGLVASGFTGNSLPFFSDVLEWWDTNTSTYTAVYYDPSDLSWKSFSDSTPSQKKFLPGEGFWVTVMSWNSGFTWTVPKPY